jgi:hypothetical protein
MPVVFANHPRAIIVSLRDGIPPSSVEETLGFLRNGTDRTCRVLFDIRHVGRLRATCLGALVYLNTQLRALGFQEPIGLWIVGHPRIESVLSGARLDTLYEIIRSKDHAARFARVRQL